MKTPVTPVLLTAAMVAEATGGRLLAGDAARAFDGVCTDTRSSCAGALFVALRGDRFDGHAFLDAAIDAGAAGVLVAAVPERDLASAVVILVDDTLRALQSLARAVRRASRARVVAITGSAGKTTTKEVTADLLEARYRVFRNRGNLNNHIGLPLSLIELRHAPDVAVVELGMNHAGEIRALVRIAEPDVRVWTNVGDAHIGFFGSREAVAAAKAEILEDATADAVIVANADDPLVMAHVRRSSMRTVTFGESARADVRARVLEDRGFDGVRAEVTCAAGSVRLDVPLPGRAHLSNVLAAVAVATEFGVDLPAIAARVGGLTAVARRGASAMSSRGARVIDDSYNASPAAVLAALQALAATPATGRRVVVLGDMLELGDQAVALHEACGREAGRVGIDVVVAVGGRGAEAVAAGARAAGLAADCVLRFADSAAAAAAVVDLVRPGDVVLVKGSRGTRTDIVADRLQEVA